MPAMRADSELASSSSSTSSKDVLAATPGGPAAGLSPSSRDAAMMRSFRLLMNASSAAAFSSAAPSPPERQRLARGWQQARSLGLLGSAMHPAALRFLCGAPPRSAPAYAVAPRDCQGPQEGPWKPYTAGLLSLPRCSGQALLSALPLARNFRLSTAQKPARSASPHGTAAHPTAHAAYGPSARPAHAPVCTALRCVGGSLQVRLLRGAQFSNDRPSKNFRTSSPKAACTRSAPPRLRCLCSLALGLEGVHHGAHVFRVSIAATGAISACAGCGRSAATLGTACALLARICALFAHVAQATCLHSKPPASQR